MGFMKLEGLVEHARRLPKPLVVAIALGMAAIIGTVDWLTGRVTILD